MATKNNQKIRDMVELLALTGKEMLPLAREGKNYKVTTKTLSEYIGSTGGGSLPTDAAAQIEQNTENIEIIQNNITSLSKRVVAINSRVTYLEDSDFVDIDSLRSTLGGYYTKEQVDDLLGEAGGVDLTGYVNEIAASGTGNGIASVSKDGSKLIFNKTTFLTDATVPAARTTLYGGIKIGYKDNGKNYGVLLDDSGKAYVNVPWESYDLSKFLDKAGGSVNYLQVSPAKASDSETINIGVTANEISGTHGNGTVDWKINSNGAWIGANQLATQSWVDGKGYLTSSSPLASANLDKNTINIAGTPVSLGGSITQNQLITNLGLKGLAFKDSVDYNDLSNKPTIPSAVTESTVSGWGFTKNAGTITGIKMNGASKGTSGVVDLGTVLTSHQTIHGLTITSSDGYSLTYTPNSSSLSITLGKSWVGLGNVENTKLSTWAGSANITTLGTITSGTWKGSKIGQSYLDLSGYLPLSGGTISSNMSAKVTLQAGAASRDSWIEFSDKETSELYAIGIRRPTSEYGLQYKSGNEYHYILHSGNIGSYAVTSSNLESTLSDYPLANGTRATGTWGIDIHGAARRLISPYYYTFDETRLIHDSTTSDELFGDHYSFSAMMKNHSLFNGWATVWNFSAYEKYGGTQFAVLYDTQPVRAALRTYRQHVSGWGDWREIAFTDSTVAAAKTLVNDSETKSISVDNKGQLKVIGWGIGDNASKWQICTAGYIGNTSDSLSDSLELKNNNGIVLASYYIGLILNSSGNVTIGSSDLAGTRYKLYVDGKLHIREQIYSDVAFILRTTDGTAARASLSHSSNTLYIQSGYNDGSNTAGRMMLSGVNTMDLALLDVKATKSTFNGNVGIGTTNPQAKLDVNGIIFGNQYNASGNKAGAGLILNKGTNFVGMGASGQYSWNFSVGTVNLDGTWINELLTITDGGKVGIGTTNPNTKLHVVGGTKITGGLTVGSATDYIAYDGSSLTGYKSSSSAWSIDPSGNGSFASLTVGGNAVLTQGALTSINSSLNNKANTADVIPWSATHNYASTVNPNVLTSPISDRWYLVVKAAGNGNALMVNVPWVNTTYDLSSYLLKAGGRISGSLTFSATSGSHIIGNADNVLQLLPGTGSAPVLPIKIAKLSSGRHTIYCDEDQAYDLGTSSYSYYYVYSRYSSASSDATKKNIIGNIPLTTAQIANAPAVSFTWKDSGEKSHGTIAQYWKEILPEFVSGDEGSYGLNYAALGVVSSIILARNIETHEQRIARLEKEISDLQKELNALVNNE